jgi:DNA-binding MarR family transcriptional regulator
LGGIVRVLLDDIAKAREMVRKWKRKMVSNRTEPLGLTMQQIAMIATVLRETGTNPKNVNQLMKRLNVTERAIQHAIEQFSET